MGGQLGSRLDADAKVALVGLENLLEQSNYVGDLAYAGQIERGVEVKDAVVDSKEEWQKNLYVHVQATVGYWERGYLGISACVCGSGTGTLKRFGEKLTAETPAHIDAFVSDVVRKWERKAKKQGYRVGEDKMDEVKDTLRKEIEELVIG